MKELLQAKSPTKEFDKFKKARLIYPECTASEDAIIKKALQPCGEDIAFELFFRYLVSHGFKEKHPDQEKRDIIRDDFLAHMATYPEYVVTIALIDHLETSKKPWFPTLGELIEMLDKHKLYEPRIMRWERGFQTKEEIAEMYEAGENVDKDAVVARIYEEQRQRLAEKYKQDNLEV